MRTDKTIYVVVEGEEIYDPNTGDYIVGEPVKTELKALVTDTGTERMNFLYGKIKQNAKTIRLNQKYTNPYDFIEIDGEKYQVDNERSYRHKMSIEVSGV